MCGVCSQEKNRNLRRFCYSNVCHTQRTDPHSGQTAAATPRNYTGQYLDQTGLLFYNARYYDPVIGRFISPDTIVPGSGVSGPPEAGGTTSIICRARALVRLPDKALGTTFEPMWPEGPIAKALWMRTT